MNRPLISVITPVYNTPELVLRVMIESVRSQSFTDWELCLVDDGSPSARPGEVMAEYASLDPRIRVTSRSSNGGIVAASNDCLAMARGEFVSFLDHDDELYEGALQRTAEALRSAPDVDYVYTDEDKLDEFGNRSAPFFKPDWSPERFRYQMYSCHFGTMRRSLVQDVGGFRPEFEGSQDFDLVFRVTERARKVVHIPEVLYGWRIIAGSAAGDTTAKPYAYTAGQRAVQAHCDRTGFQAEVTHDPGDPGRYRLQPRLSDRPKVSIVISTAGSSSVIHGRDTPKVVRSVASVVSKSTYDNYEIIVVAAEGTPSEVLEALDSLGHRRLRIVRGSDSQNFSAQVNGGVLSSTGEHVVVLNDNTEVITADWMESMLMYSMHQGIGAVGPKLLFEDTRLASVGMSLGRSLVRPMSAYRGLGQNHGGYFGDVIVARDVLAVHAACLMSSREAFESVGGFSESFPEAYADVDYGLKLHTSGLRVAYNPEVSFYHYEPMLREPVVEDERLHEFMSRWSRFVGNDPFDIRRGQRAIDDGHNIAADYGIGMERRSVRA